jgi:NHL repeat
VNNYQESADMEDQVLNITLKKGFTPEKVIPQYPISEQLLVFYGDEGNPFLAPRGVCIHDQVLAVADTGQNRVFIWLSLPQSRYQSPDIVLGQTDSDGTSRNGGLAVNASSLMYPSGIWTDGKILVVADAWNHRVLIWTTFPTQDGQAADIVLGQKDFISNQPNVSGIGSTPSASSLNWPYGVYSDGTALYIADTGNRRVLKYNNMPTDNFQAADDVIGKATFDDRDYESDDAIWPYSIKIGKRGQVAITDTQYYRILLWQNVQDALEKKSNAVIGQPDLMSNGQNQFNLFPTPHTLSWCYDTCFYKDGILVADTGNSRILWFDNLPQVHNTGAIGLIGKSDFNTGSENLDTIYGTDKTIYWPFSIAVDEDTNQLIIADTGNHRIIFHRLIV